MKQGCFECGEIADHWHHVIPKSLGGTKTIPLCFKCHGLAHSSKTSSRELVKEGIAKYRKENGTWGRAPKVSPETIHELVKNGWTCYKIGKHFGVDAKSIYRSYKRFLAKK